MAFQYVLTTEDSAAQRAWTNQRASVRYHCGPATLGRVDVAEKHEFLRAWIMNLSTHGMGLIIPRQLEMGQLVVISVRSRASARTYELPAHVAHVAGHPQGEWLVGFEFAKPLNGDDLEALL